MKLIDFYKKLIVSISLEISNILQPIDNSLRYVLRNESKMQILKIYILINNTTTYCIYYIYPSIIEHFLAFLRVRIRVRARTGSSIKKIILPFVNKQSGKKHLMTFYAHYCLDCQMMYFGKELNVIKPCVRCGSKKVLNGPLIASKEKSANVAEVK